MQINIFKAEISDYPQILLLFQEFALFEKLPDKMVNSVERMIAEKDYFNCLVAKTAEGRIVAYASYFLCYYTWIGKCLYMDDLYVTSEFRGQGLGTRLINNIIEVAKQSNCHKMRWQVSRWNSPAIKFYQSLGAIVDNEEQNCDLYL